MARWVVTGLLSVGLVSSAFGFAYRTEEDVPLNQMWDDTLNGRVPVLDQATVEGSAASLTDAVSADQPWWGVIPAPDNTPWGVMTWDLSDLGPRDLRKVSIWVNGGDNMGRHSIWVHINVKYGDDIGYTPLDVPAYFTVEDANAQFNHVEYTWDWGEVTNVTGLQVVTQMSFYGLHARLVEIDAVLPAPARLEGKVRLDGFVADNATAGVNFTLQPVDGTETIVRRVFLGSDGSFSLDNIPPGRRYMLTAKTDTSLRTVVNDVAVDADPTVLLEPIVLKGGDSNGDGNVSFEDFAILQNNYGQGDQSAGPLAAAATGGCGALGLALMTILGVALRCRD